jgi:hypothetical protein
MAATAVEYRLWVTSNRIGLAAARWYRSPMASTLVDMTAAEGCRGSAGHDLVNTAAVGLYHSSITSGRLILVVVVRIHCSPIGGKLVGKARWVV